GLPVSPSKMHASTRKIEEAYHAQGRLHATVTFTRTHTVIGEVIKLTINEGPEVHVGKLAIVGLHTLKDDEVRKALKSVPAAVYLPEELERDAFVLNGALYDRGLLQSRVDTPAVSSSPNGATVDIAIKVDEGKVFRIGAIKLAGDLRGEDKALRDLIPQ